MRMSHLIAVVAVLGSLGGCAHRATPSSPPLASAPTASYAAEVEPDESDELEDAPDTVESMLSQAGPNATVVVMEADDFGGGPDAVTAPPKRPSMPSFMTDIAMAPSR